jgi:hypothetical protein
MATFTAKIKRNVKEFNSYTWAGLTKGKLLCIAGAMAKEHKSGNLLAYDCYREITNYLYDNDRPEYEYVIKQCDLK